MAVDFGDFAVFQLILAVLFFDFFIALFDLFVLFPQPVRWAARQPAPDAATAGATAGLTLCVRMLTTPERLGCRRFGVSE